MLLIKIREVTSSNFEQWLPLWNSYNRFYGRPDFSIEITNLTWSRFLDPNEPVYGLIAVSEGKCLGLTHYIFHRSTIQINMNCYLQDLFTIEEARGKGVGRALIEAVYEKAKARGSKRVYWQTHQTNIPARKLYNSMAELSEFVIYNRYF
jgi:GNAT superfamily N-acetyltransferase